MKAELQRAGFKNSYSNQINETVAKELGISFVTIYNWKRELGQTKPKKYTHSEQKELMKRYYEINDQNLKMNVGDIAKMLNIGLRTLVNWKRQFKRQHCIQILLMDIQWKRMPRQMFRQNLKGEVVRTVIGGMVGESGRTSWGCSRMQAKFGLNSY
uniref:Transposase n=1 Tax=Globodera rostochiensis TaxID=31243 RepID=A0A914HLY6_GLORO